MSELRVSGLELGEAVEVRRLIVSHVTVMIRQELYDLPLLVRREQIQQVGCVPPEPEQTNIITWGEKQQQNLHT